MHPRGVGPYVVLVIGTLTIGLIIGAIKLRRVYQSSQPPSRPYASVGSEDDEYGGAQVEMRAPKNLAYV